MSPHKKQRFGIGMPFQFIGAACFFVVIPFGIAIGSMRRLFGATHPPERNTPKA